MDHLQAFVINHWELWLLFFVLLAMIVRLEMSSHVSGLKMLTSPQLTQMVNREHAVILDIRDKDAYNAGHITKARNFPLADIEGSLKKLQQLKTKPVILCCKAGAQSPKAAAVLRKNGFEDLYGLKGGIVAWQDDKMPLISKAAK